MANPGIISLDSRTFAVNRTLTVNEEVGEAIIPVVRTEGSDGTVSVDYSVKLRLEML